ncbi:hypothetical protein P43SY_012134 [Pythium insidiosum]|uniref:Alkyl hydroperoxide reductase subunit C/ Thiol specific antioxidant domain-containing protein n=1 Tax=Pythium insidiosum TaxID=114742 RepID=A0AAD5LSR6_PYTIN|nr:hypothetical protein P43SY_012134 [Pythium insidiosum]
MCPERQQQEKGLADVGLTAPEFTAQAVANGEPNTVSLKDYCGKYVLVFFYPLDSFVAEAFSQIGCEVLGCSTDSKFLHLAWINTPRKKGGLGDDYNKEIVRAYNVVIEEIENASRDLLSG